MNEVLKVILSMSLSGGIVIIMLLLVLRLFGKKLSRQWQYYIWLIAIIRLLIPFAPQKNLMSVLSQSAETTISSMESLSVESIQNKQVSDSGWRQQENTEVEELNVNAQETDDNVSDETVGESVNKVNNEKLVNIVRPYLWLIWILPAFILIIRKIIVYQNFVKYIRMGSDDVQDIVLLEHFGKLLEKNHIRNTITLSINDMVASPIMTGFFKPGIILPSTEMTTPEFEHTILHELIHYRRRDILYKWLTQLTICIHWFNPLSYVLGRIINRTCELSCDEALIQKLNAQERCAYGDTLLNAAARNVKYKTTISTIAFSDSKKNLKERLDAIMNFRKKTRASFIITIFLSVMIFAGSFYLGVYAVGKQDIDAKSISKSGTSDGKSEQAPHSVLYRDGEYFILFDNADKNDIPGSTGPDYGVTFGAVWPDTYVSFDSYYVNTNLTKNVRKDCSYMQNKGWLTKKEANAIIDVASKVQNGDTGSFQTDKREKEYGQWNIQIKNGIYYYKKKRIRILMDTRKNRSFNFFNYDEKGTVDLKIIRNKNNTITKIKKLSKNEAKQVLDDLK